MFLIQDKNVVFEEGAQRGPENRKPHRLYAVVISKTETERKQCIKCRRKIETVSNLSKRKTSLRIPPLGGPPKFTIHASFYRDFKNHANSFREFTFTPLYLDFTIHATFFVNSRFTTIKRPNSRSRPYLNSRFTTNFSEYLPISCTATHSKSFQCSPS